MNMKLGWLTLCKVMQLISMAHTNEILNFI